MPFSFSSNSVLKELKSGRYHSNELEIQKRNSKMVSIDIKWYKYIVDITQNARNQ